MELRSVRHAVGEIPWALIGAAVLTALVGVYNLASASRNPDAVATLEAGTLTSGLWLTQLLFFVLSVGLVVAVALVDSRLIQRFAVPFYLLNLAALVALRFVGHRAKGAESWLVLGPFRLQPAELMKIAVVVMLAKYFHDDYRPASPHYSFQRLIPPAVIAVVPTVLVLVQPDLGTALMMGFTTLTILLFARPRWSVLVVLSVLVVAGLGAFWNDWVRPQNEPRFTLVRHKLKKHQDGRIVGWLDPTADLKGTNYHAMQSKIAVGSGGLTGKGWMKGTQTGLRYLPEQHTDFIFSVWAEEQGYVKCLMLLALYGVMLVGALRIAMGAKERFAAYLAVGIAAMIFWQVFENIGMVSGLMPITGITLPLMSYGGSSMVSVMLGVGLLVNIGMRRTRGRA